MTAPVDANIIIPTDTTNSGKKLRTQTQLVGSDTVHSQYVVPVPAWTITGKYLFSSGYVAVLASAQNGTSTGAFWFQMPVAATVTALIRFITAEASAVGAATVAITAPVISFSKFTFTGTASGATVANLPYKTGGTVSQMIARSAVTGMTVTVVAPFGQFIIPYVQTAVGVLYSQKVVIDRSTQANQRGYDLEIGPGEGVLVYQTTGGTTSDVRGFGFQMEWLEIDLT